VESRYPPDSKGLTLAELIHGNDPHITHLGSGEPRFAKVLDNLRGGRRRKLLRSIPLISCAQCCLDRWRAPFVLGTMDERHGFEWMVPPEEPVEKVQEDKNRPPDAPTLRRTPSLNCQESFSMESPRRITPPSKTRAQHAPPSPKLFAKSGTNCFHLSQGCIPH